MAAAAEMSASILLYSTDGFLPALTLILTLEAGAVALGLWSGTFQVGKGAVEEVRRRWLFTLVTFAIAAAFSTGMTFMESLLTGGVGQGLGLALLGSFPLFALGSLLGAMVRLGGRATPVAAAVGVPSVAGLSLGFLLTGGLLLPNMAPYTLYLVCLTALSGGALLQGWVLDARPPVRVLESRWTARGEIRVEERVGGRDGDTRRILLEGGRVRGCEDLAGGSGRAWEGAVLTVLKEEEGNSWPILYLGGGSGTLIRILSRETAEREVVVIEGSEELTQVARAHLHPFPGWRKAQLLVGDPWALMRGLDGPYPLILLDCGLLPALGTLPVVPDEAWGELGRLAGIGGRVVLGGLGEDGPLGDVPLAALMERALQAFQRTTWYRGEGGAFLLLSGPETPPWPEDLSGFRVEARKEA